MTASARFVFAWPVLHRTAGDYALVANAAVLGRPFCQPLVATADDFAIGLELWIKSGAPPNDPVPFATLFACLDGMLRFTSAAPSAPAYLELLPDGLAQLNVMEGTPGIRYVNVDPTTLIAVLADTILQLYRDPAQHTHPLLLHTRTKEEIEEAFRVAKQAASDAAAADPSKAKKKAVTRKSIPRTVSTPLMDQLTRAGDDAAALTAVATTFLNGWMSASASTPAASLPVRAGNPIGRASPTAPANRTAPDPDHVCYQRFEIHDASNSARSYEQVRNPLHDLWIWIDSPLLLKPSMTTLGVTSAPFHPIVELHGGNGVDAKFRVDSANPTRLLPPKPPSRLPTLPTGPVPVVESRLIPLMSLSTEWQHFGQSRIEWKFARDGTEKIQIRVREGFTADVPPVSDPPFVTVAGAVWNTYKQFIVEICKLFQVPSEIVIMMIGIEDGTGVSGCNGQQLTGRCARFEPITLADYEKDNPGISTNADAIIYADLYQGNGGNRLIPLTAAGTLDVNGTYLDPGHRLSWQRYYNLLVDYPGAFPARVSTGIIHTTVETANTTVKLAEKWFEDVRRDPAFYPLQASTIWELAGVAAPPAIKADLLAWIASPRQGLALGVAFIRDLYNKQGTGWDAMKHSAAYNHGRLSAAKAHDKTWGMLVFDDVRLSHCPTLYNQAVKILTQVTVDPEPFVRLEE